MAKFPTIEEFVQQVKERVLAECLIDGEPLGELIDSGDLVHVCRCKDCKHRPHKDERGHIVPVEEDEECSPCPCVDDGDWYYNYIPKDDWYCANGEPKDSTAEVRRQLKETEQRKEMERKK